MEWTKKQIDVLIGNLLGDGSITNRRRSDGVLRNAHFEISQKADNLEYLNYIKNVFAPYSKNITFRSTKAPIRMKDGSITRSEIRFLNSCRMRTCSSTFLTKIHSSWYVDSKKCFKKIVPPDIELNWRRIAFWFCDDGTNRRNRKEITFATMGFESSCRAILQKELDRLKISTTEWSDARLSVRCKHYDYFLSKVSPFIPWDCFKYKIQ